MVTCARKGFEKNPCSAESRQTRFVLFFNLFIPFFHTHKKKRQWRFFWHGGTVVLYEQVFLKGELIVRHVVALFCQYLGEIKRGGEG